jgi:DNA-binding IclR family transcriptional regulator
MPQREHRSTSRVLDILELVARSQDGYTLSQLAEKLEAPKSSLSPIVGTLRDRHFLRYSDASLHYKIGPAAFTVGMQFVNRLSMLQLVDREMDHIVSRCLETVFFAILDGGNVVYLLKKDSPQAIRMIANVGLSLPAYGTGIGKALLIDHSLAALKAAYPEGLKPLTPNTITDFQILLRQLTEFKKEDISYECEESNKDIRCVGTALRRNGKIIAALSVAIPVFRCDEEKLRLSRDLLLQSKKSLEAIFQNTDVDFLSR